MPRLLAKTLKIVFSIVIIILVAYVSWFFFVSSSYIADVFACRAENSECSESEASTAKVNYDTMDALYYIHSLYLGIPREEVKLKDFCLVKKETNYSANCKDKNGNSWNVTLIELRW